ncbi:hypothetical protein [Pseudotabrizicola formosa]|uniref:hypothetical protein n=1 Tax=Pseudotabrizicola formosa TaxID=2030009 RepID=UPI0011AF0E54|nr:hypothetical protein [Pseudotabrizicola formosa]
MRQSTISMVNRYGRNMAKIRRFVKVFLSLAVIFHQSAAMPRIVELRATKTGQLWWEKDLWLFRAILPGAQMQTGRALRGPCV